MEDVSQTATGFDFPRKDAPIRKSEKIVRCLVNYRTQENCLIIAWVRVFPTCSLALFALVLSACGNSRCPQGYSQNLGRCEQPSQSQPDASSDKHTVHCLDGCMLAASDGNTADTFGSAVAISETTIAIGSPRDDDTESNAGSVYLFELSEEGIWEQKQKIIPGSGSENGRFGTSVSIDNEILVIGAPYENKSVPFNEDTDLIFTEAGAVYVYEKSDTDLWEFVTLLSPETHFTNNHFGMAVAVHGNTIIAGSPNQDDDTGSVTMFIRDNNNDWTRSETFIPNTGTNGDVFGTSLALKAERFIVGTPGRGVFNGFSFMLQNGAAFVFEKQASGIWEERATLVPPQEQIAPDLRLAEHNAVAMFDEHIVVGALFDDLRGQDSGSARVFSRNDSNGWDLQQTLLPTEGSDGVAFGDAVALNSKYLAVSATLFEDRGKVSVFTRDSNGQWTLDQELEDPEGNSGDLYGIELALDEAYLVVGAEKRDAKGTNSGAVFVYGLE